jgi:hypothetical protein
MKTKLTTNSRFGKVAAVFIALSIFLSACHEETVVPTEIPVLDSDIFSDMTLIDTLVGVDYYVDGCITVDAALLTVMPNVTVQFKSGGCIIFTNGAALKAVGNDVQVITFEGQQHTKGFWKGIYYENSNSANNNLEYFNVKDAGGSTNEFRQAAINVGTTPVMGETASRIKMNNVTISNSLGYGLYVSRTAIIDQMNNCTITGCTKAPVQLMATNCGVLDDDNIYTGNGYNYIEIDGSGVANNQTTDDFTIRKLSIPYSLIGEFDVQDHIIVEPGTQFIMQANAWIYVGNSGNLDLLGNSGNRIVLSGEEHTKGFWRGITVENDALLDLDYVDVADAGNADNGLVIPQGSISAAGFGNTQLSVTNSTFSNSLHNGIAINSSQVTYNPNIATSNTFSNIDEDNVHIY